MKRMNTCLLLMFIMLCLCIPEICVLAEDSDTIVYDAADFPNLTGRTKQEVMEKYTEAQKAGTTYVQGAPETYYDEPASIEAPYAAGVLSSDTLKAMEGMTNFYRWLIGVGTLTVNTESNASLQAQALNRNFEFNHWISNESKPEDMDDDLWAEGFGMYHNILARGYNPTGAVTGWLNEGYYLSAGLWETVGHRRSILDAKYKNIIYRTGNIR